jgi:chemotaxis protein CheD
MNAAIHPPSRDARDRHYDPHLRCVSVKLLPGDYFATREEVALVTVLGSCVAACLHDPKEGIGGMNHFMLPRGREDSGPASTPARYGVHAMELLINELVRLGARRCNLEAKVFGGGNVLEGVTALGIGQANAEFVCEFLRAESIPMIAEDLQGTVSRKVCFFPASGRALVRGIQRSGNRAIAEQEARYRAELRSLPGGGQVEFFR